MIGCGAVLAFHPANQCLMPLRISDAAAVVVPLRAPVVRFGAVPVSVPLYAQRAGNWCWLAVAQMAADTPPRSLKLSQCTLASSYISGAKGCCTKVNSICDQAGDPVDIGQIYTDHAVSFSVSTTPALEAAVLTALSSGFLVEVGWQTAFQGHVVLVVGTHVDAAGNNRYSVNDPDPVNVGQIRNLDFAGLLNPPLVSSGGGPYRWTYTWSDIH